MRAAGSYRRGGRQPTGFVTHSPERSSCRGARIDDDAAPRVGRLPWAVYWTR